MQVGKVFGLPFHQGELGLEIEVESKNELPHRTTPDWVTKGEGSLRFFGTEYVSCTPTWNNPGKFQKLNKLSKILDLYPIIKDSPRTSVHVHVNVQKFSLSKVYATICAYWLLENLLVKFCGEEYREGNHFCLRLVDAEAVLKTCKKDLLSKDHFEAFRRPIDKALRYSALNLAAIPTFGSVEFRAMRGTIDPQLIDLWSSELHSLCYSIRKKYNDPAQLMDDYFQMPKIQFMRYLFSNNFTKTLAQFKHWEDLIEENEGSVCELAYAVDWKDYFSKPEEHIVKQLPKKKKKVNFQWNVRLQQNQIIDVVNDLGQVAQWNANQLIPLGWKQVMPEPQPAKVELDEIIARLQGEEREREDMDVFMEPDEQEWQELEQADPGPEDQA